MVDKIITVQYHKRKNKSVGGSKSKDAADEDTEKMPPEHIQSKGTDSSEKAEKHGKALDENSAAQNSSMGVVEVGKGESISKRNGLPEKESEEKAKMPKKRKAGADWVIAQASVSSPDVGSSRLRPRKDLPSFRKLELSENGYEKIVGKRVKVLWPDSRKWFKGYIKSFDSEKKLHSILYDDGDKEELDLTRERFEIEVKPSEAFILLSNHGPNPESKEMDSDGGEVGSEAKQVDLLRIDDAESKLKKKIAPKVDKGGSSKLQIRTGTESEKGEDMDVVVLPEKDEELMSEAGDAATPGDTSSVKSYDEAQASKFEPNPVKKEMVSESGDVRGYSVKNDSCMSHNAKGMEQVAKSKGEIASKLAKSGSSNLKDINDNEKELVEKVDAPGEEVHGETESLSEIPSVSNKSVAEMAKKKELGGEDTSECGLKTNIQGSFEADGNQSENLGQLSLVNQKMASSGGSDEPPSDEPTKKSGSPVNLKTPVRRGRPRGKTKK